MTFIRSFGSGEEELFKSVHSKDVVRVIQDAGHVFGYDHHFKKTPESLKAKWPFGKRTLNSDLPRGSPARIRPLKWGFTERQA